MGHDGACEGFDRRVHRSCGVCGAVYLDGGLDPRYVGGSRRFDEPCHVLPLGGSEACPARVVVWVSVGVRRDGRVVVYEWHVDGSRREDEFQWPDDEERVHDVEGGRRDPVAL